jgi:hypothetical protein
MPRLPGRLLGLLVVGATLGCRPSAARLRNLDPEAGPPAELVVRNENREREEFGRAMRVLLQARQYDSLDRIARDLRQQKAKWPNGYWKLRSFYLYGFDQPDVTSSETQWKTLLSQLRDWAATRPNSVTARVALATALVGYGWHARGEGWGHEVSDAGNHLFEERLSQADSVLVSARRLPESCPGTAAMLQRVAMGLGWPRTAYDSLVKAAIQSEPTFELYYEQAATYLLPRWYGKDGEWERFASDVADQLGGAEGDAMYARIVWSKDEYYKEVFKESAASWERTSRGYQQLLHTYPHSLELQSQYAFLAAEADDRDQARALVDRLGPRVDPAVWKTRDYFVSIRDWAMQ